jgi:hypothetical protein
MLINGSGSTLPIGWSKGGAVSPTILCEITSLGAGKTISMTSITGGQTSLIQSPTIATVIGKRYLALVKHSSTMSGSKPKVEIYMRATADSNNRQYLLQDCYVAQDDGIYMLDFVADVDSYRLFMTASGTLTSVTAKLAQVTIFCVDDYTL